jgi:hypothetical protein
MKRSIGFRVHLSFFTLGMGGHDAGLKLHHSDLASVFVLAVGEDVRDASAASAASAQAAEALKAQMHMETDTLKQ